MYLNVYVYVYMDTHIEVYIYKYIHICIYSLLSYNEYFNTSNRNVYYCHFINIILTVTFVVYISVKNMLIDIYR
jgi:hypothetical protein